jgi:thymidylate synthase ThyX
MSIKANIIADSVNSTGCRLTTFILEFPRFVLAELNTHRVFSKNAASSRAIPVEKMIQQVIDNPAMPVWWGKNQSGMQAKEELDNVGRKLRLTIQTHEEYSDWYIGEKNTSLPGAIHQYFLTDREYAKVRWLEARDSAIWQVRELLDLGVHKQIANRILEPWFNIRVILSGTEFENFYKLRAHPDAQPEFQALAYMMQGEHQKSVPKQLEYGDWHIPFGDNIDSEKLLNELNLDKDNHGAIEEAKLKIAVARCARVSYFNYEGKDDYAADIKLCNRLFQSDPKHLSPTEHVAMNIEDDYFHGNFKGFQQYRKIIE